jgi:hypothetical protein
MDTVLQIFDLLLLPALVGSALGLVVLSLLKDPPRTWVHVCFWVGVIAIFSWGVTALFAQVTYIARPCECVASGGWGILQNTFRIVGGLGMSLGVYLGLSVLLLTIRWFRGLSSEHRVIACFGATAASAAIMVVSFYLSTTLPCTDTCTELMPTVTPLQEE